MAAWLTLTKKDGVVTLDKSFESACSRLRNGTYTVSIDRRKDPRTMSQNALMWLWFACIEGGTGTLRQDVHDYYCEKFLRERKVIFGVERWVTMGTKGLSTAQMTDFMNKVQADALTELGITLPLPQDRYYQEFILEYNR